MNDTFSSWINSAECYAFLRECAKQASSRAGRLGIVLDDAYLENENRDDYLSAVAGEMWQFLKSNADRIALQATSLLLTGDDDFMAFLCRQFLDYCVEQRRSTSPFHDYYRRMRTLLHQTDGVVTLSHARKCSYYAYSCRTDLERLPADLSNVDYGEWNDCAVSLSDIFQKSAMLELSKHFWKEAYRRFLEEYLLPIRDLVKYTCTKYPLLLKVEYRDAQGEADDGEGSAISLENHLVDFHATTAFDDAWKRQLPIIEADVIDTQLDTLARDCTVEMTGLERIILSQLDAGEKLETIAALLNMKGPSNVSYHQKKAYSKIYDKWSLWGPPSPRQFVEIDEEEFFMFYEKVIGYCKIDESCREINKEHEHE